MAGKDREILFLGLSVAGLMLFCFLAGGMAAYYKFFPYQIIDRAVQAMDAEKLEEQIIKRHEMHTSFVKDEVIKVIHKKGAFEGYTLYTTEPSPGPTTAALLDMDGNPVHEWTMPYSQLKEKAKLPRVLPDKMMYWFDAYLYPNGDLLGLYQAYGSTPYGAGLVKLDKDSHVLWNYNENVHHALDVNPNGTITVLLQKITPPPVYDGITFINESIFSDSVAQLTPDGKEIRRISLIDALAKSQYREILIKRISKAVGKGDILHTNSAVTLPESMAAAFPMFKPGQILVSMRNLDLIGILDPDTGVFTWCMEGPWHGQHYVRFSKDGTIIIFDNKGDAAHGTRILKYHPGTGNTDIVYAAANGETFSSPYAGMQQELPNGNLLVTEAVRGRIFEINKKKEIVWQFIDPYHRKKHPFRITVGRRYGAQELPFITEKTASGSPP